MLHQPGQDPGFSSRGGATSHTHTWVWLRFCIATFYYFSHHLLCMCSPGFESQVYYQVNYACAALGLSHRSIIKSKVGVITTPPPPPPPSSGSSSALASRHHPFKSNAVPVYTDYIRNYTHSKIELLSQKGGGGGGGFKGGVHIEFRSKGGGAHPLHPPSGSNPDQLLLC